MRVYFLILSAFSATGGLEKFNRAFMKALNEIAIKQKFDFSVIASHDKLQDNRYIPAQNFAGFGGNKIKFTLNCISKAKEMDLVFVGHINIAPVAVFLKILNPRIKLILIGHGIEIWGKQIFFKKLLLKMTDRIIAVSNYTKNRIVSNNNIDESKITVFHNTLDPYFNIPIKFEKPAYLLKRYGIEHNTKVILTVTRINKFEGYKGYDQVLDALPTIVKEIPDVKYILSGKYDMDEEKRIKSKVNSLGVEEHFILTGFVKEEELVDHYLLADVFILPSKKEGFGIVFIEAAACGIPVISGNKDGSVDALLNGRIGKLVDPDNLNEIKDSIINTIKNPVKNNQDLVIENFGFDHFREILRTLLIDN